MNIKIPFEPFEQQLEIRNHPARFRVIDCGRRWGKSTFSINELVRILYERHKELKRRVRGWIVAPTFSMVEEDWQIALKMFQGAIKRKPHSTKMRMYIEPGITLEFKSADEGDEKLRGAGLDALLMDEAARIRKSAWESGLRPALADRQGKGIFISTPKGRNWFHDVYLMGKEGTEWKSWHYPTNSRPSFPKEEWEVIVKTTPERILKQEYLAEFLEDEATVFHNLSSCFRGVLESPIDGETYVFGVDLARTVDWTVITGIKKSTKQVVYFSRHKETDWSLQKDLIKAISMRYKAKMLLDSTGVGDPIEEDLRKAGVRVEGYKFNNTTKQELVEQLIVAIEQSLIGIPDVPILIDELKAFEYELLPSGRIRYQAPEGLHDDAVISLGLAVMGIRHNLYNRPKPDEVKEKPNSWKSWHDKVKKFNYLSIKPQNRNFSPNQIWEHVNA